MIIAEKIPLIHDWYCAAMGGASGPARLALDQNLERLWYEWLTRGFTPQDLRRVMRYLRLQIPTGKRNPGSLKLSNLLQPDQFAADLVLASADLDPEKKLPPSLKWTE